jgi:hypothetical protein
MVAVLVKAPNPSFHWALRRKPRKAGEIQTLTTKRQLAGFKNKTYNESIFWT